MVVVADLPLAIAALLILLVLVSLGPLKRLIGYLVPTGMPVIGGWLHTHVVDAVDGAIDRFGAALDSALHHLTGWLVAPFKLARAGLGEVETALGALYGMGRRIVTVHLAELRRWVDRERVYLRRRIYAGRLAAEALARSLVRAALGTVTGELAGVRRWARALVSSAVAGVEHDLAAVRAYAAGRAVAAEHYADALFARAAGLASAVLTKALAYTDREVAALASSTTAAIGAAERALAADVSAAAAGTAQQVTGALDAAAGAAWGPVAGAVEADAQAAAGVLGGIDAELGRLVGQIPWAKAASLAGSMAVAAGMTQVLTRFLRECGAPGCRNLGQYGSELSRLLGALDDGWLLALLASAATNPGGLAGDLVGELSGPVGEAAASVRSAVGV